MGRFGPTHRKIPTAKRHGVRDPLKRLADQEEAIKNKINNPPKERDVQEVSQNFKRFLKLKEQSNSGQPRKERRPKAQPKLQIGTTVVHKLQRESEQTFLDRATQIQQARTVEADFGVKFGVEVERDETTGAIKIRKRKGLEVDEMLQADQKGGKHRKRVAKASKLSYGEKKAAKQEKERERQHQEDDLLLREYQYDYVPFGEVVQGPPTLHTLPRRANKQEGASRPASKRLLLHSLVEPPPEEEHLSKTAKKAVKKAAPSKVDLKGKRKNLPVATRLRIEHEQQNVIDMYRKLKHKGNK